MRELILLTGATGYVGGRLLRRLEELGCPVRCLARRPEFLQAHVGPQTKLVRGDVLDAAPLSPALRDVLWPITEPPIHDPCHLAQCRDIHCRGPSHDTPHRQTPLVRVVP